MRHFFWALAVFIPSAFCASMTDLTWPVRTCLESQSAATSCVWLKSQEDLQFSEKVVRKTVSSPSKARFTYGQQPS